MIFGRNFLDRERVAAWSARRSTRVLRLGASLACIAAAPGANAQLDAGGLDQTLAKTASGSWSRAELHAALQRLGESFDCPIWLDRRVDPATPLELTVAATSLADLINRVAESCELGAARVGSVVYVGPAAASIAARPPPSAGRLRRTGELRWGRLAEPRLLVLRVARETRIRLANPEAIPHDLWEAGGWPELTAADRLTLLLVGAGLTWVEDASIRNGVRVEPLTSPTDERPTRLPTPSVRPDRPDDARRYTLTVRDKPLEQVAQQLGVAFGLQLRFDPAVTVASRQQRVSFRVEKASGEATLHALAAAGGLRVSRLGDVVTLAPGP